MKIKKENHNITCCAENLHWFPNFFYINKLMFSCKYGIPPSVISRHDYDLIKNDLEEVINIFITKENIGFNLYENFVQLTVDDRTVISLEVDTNIAIQKALEEFIYHSQNEYEYSSSLTQVLYNYIKVKYVDFYNKLSDQSKSGLSVCRYTSEMLNYILHDDYIINNKKYFERQYKIDVILNS